MNRKRETIRKPMEDELTPLWDDQDEDILLDDEDEDMGIEVKEE